MEKLNQLEEVLKLGNKLVNELKLQPHSNVLEKWMSQYIAELIVEIETTKSVTKKRELQKECFETITSLWSQREYLPGKVAPLSNIQGLISVLDAFRKRENRWEYASFRDNLTNPWGIFACKIKDISDELINLAIAASVADDNFEKEKMWVEHHGGILTADEKYLIETIDEMVRNNRFPFRLEGDDSNIISKKPEERNNLIFQKLNTTIERLSNSIKTLEEQIKHGNSEIDHLV